MSLRKYLPFIILLLTLGCEKDDEKTETTNENPLNIVFGETDKGETGEILYGERTVVLNSQTKEKLKEVEQDYIIFNSPQSFTLLEEGDVLFSNQTELAPNGFARKVLSIENNENTIKLLKKQKFNKVICLTIRPLKT
jgi:hypothetical protein